MVRFRWRISLRTALIPLYLIAKICCLNAFTYHPPSGRVKARTERPIQQCTLDGTASLSIRFYQLLTFSIIGIVHVAGCCIGYASYHIQSSLRQSSKLTDSNLVRVAIDLKNQYIGCILVLFLATISFIRQPALGRLIRVLFRVDAAIQALRLQLPPGTAGITANNATWLRNMLLLLVVGVGVKAVLELTNCLMYIQDNGSPFGTNCLVLCFVPQTMCVVSELQYVGYACLIRNQFQLFNRLLLDLHPALARGNGDAFRITQRITATREQLLRAIKLLSQSFGLQNTILMLFQFVTLVELGYNTCMMIIRYAESNVSQGDSLEDFSETLNWVCWFALEIFVLCYFSHATIEEAGGVAAQLNIPSVYGPVQRKHFEMVSYQNMRLFHEDPRCSCGGLFALDLSLLYGIIAATSTYLIILIQFDQSYNG
uniref:Gustatory receptor n=1 Tax=Anopheles albimanus TaxID=7167 RepID=A0A182F1A9_ANOAL